MTLLKAIDNTKSRIDNRYILISIPFVLLGMLGITDQINPHLFNPDNIQNAGGKSFDIYFLIVSISFLFFVFVIYPIRFNSIIQSIELDSEKVKITTCPFDIKYFPYKRKAIEVEADKNKVYYKALKGYLLLFVGLIGILPFSNIYMLKYKGRNYYIIPSLFKENILEALAEHT